MLQEACLVGTQNANYSTAMGEAILKEIDNVISAAVITKLSEALELPIHGGVPYLQNMTVVGIEQEINKELAIASEEYTLFVRGRFVFSDNIRLQPLFFWKFPACFLSKLESYASVIHPDS